MLTYTYIWWSRNKSTFNTVNLDRSPFTYSCAGGKALNNLKFGTFTGRFSSDKAASTAVTYNLSLVSGVRLLYVRCKLPVVAWNSPTARACSPPLSTTVQWPWSWLPSVTLARNDDYWRAPLQLLRVFYGGKRLGVNIDQDPIIAATWLQMLK